MTSQSHFARLRSLLFGALNPPGGALRIVTALVFGAAVHLLFASAALAMIVSMYFGMTQSFGSVAWPYAALVNILLILQFPVAHSFLLTRRGTRLLSNIVPGQHGGTLSTTTYAIVASLQLLLLFLCWTPSGIVWWQAEGWALYLVTALYAICWLLLFKASWDAGIEIQSGALGWLSLLAKVKPNFPDMPTTGLFRIIRQPIYVAFALTLWTVPTWTPDQLTLASIWTLYCLAAPLLKERRFAARYGERFGKYKDQVPYVLPAFSRKQIDE